MAEDKKKKDLDAFLSQFSKPVDEPFYPTPDGKMPTSQPMPKVVATEGKKVMTENNGSTAVYDNETKKGFVESAPIGVDAEPTPIIPTVTAPPQKDEGPYQPLSAQDPSFYSSHKTKTTEYAQPLEEPNVWERLLMGATPALVGLLTGNKMEGLQVAGQQLVNGEQKLLNRTYDLNAKLREMQQKREVSGSVDGKVKFGQVELFNPRTGKTEIWGTTNDAPTKFMGLKAPDADKSKWFKSTVKKGDKVYEVMVNPTSKEVMTVGEGEGKFAPRINFEDVIDPAFVDENGMPKENAPTVKNIYENGLYKGRAGLVPPKAAADREHGKQERFEEAEVNRVIKDFRNKNSKFGIAQEDALNIAKAADLLNKPNPFADEGIKTFMSRSVFGEKGPLSDFDLARLAGSGAIDDVMVRNIQRWRDGNRITNDDARAMRAVLEAVYPYIKQKAMGELEGTIKAYPKYANELGPRLRAYVEGNFPQLPAWANPNRDGVKAKNIKVPSASKPTTVIQDGHTYTLNPKTGEYE